MRLPHRRPRPEPDPLPAVRRATTGMEERWQEIGQRLEAFSTRLAGAADRMWEIADDAARQAEESDEHDT